MKTKQSPSQEFIERGVKERVKLDFKVRAVIDVKRQVLEIYFNNEDIEVIRKRYKWLDNPNALQFSVTMLSTGFILVSLGDCGITPSIPLQDNRITVDLVKAGIFINSKTDTLRGHTVNMTWNVNNWILHIPAGLLKKLPNRPYTTPQAITAKPAQPDVVTSPPISPQLELEFNEVDIQTKLANRIEKMTKNAKANIGTIYPITLNARESITGEMVSSELAEKMWLRIRFGSESSGVVMNVRQQNEYSRQQDDYTAANKVIWAHVNIRIVSKDMVHLHVHDSTSVNDNVESSIVTAIVTNFTTYERDAINVYIANAQKAYAKNMIDDIEIVKRQYEIEAVVQSLFA